MKNAGLFRRRTGFPNLKRLTSLLHQRNQSVASGGGQFGVCDYRHRTYRGCTRGSLRASITKSTLQRVQGELRIAEGLPSVQSNFVWHSETSN